jgi:hypothetical protein
MRSKKPEKKYLSFLTALWHSDSVEMINSLGYLLSAFPELSQTQGQEILDYWLQAHEKKQQKRRERGIDM